MKNEVGIKSQVALIPFVLRENNAGLLQLILPVRTY